MSTRLLSSMFAALGGASRTARRWRSAALLSCALAAGAAPAHAQRVTAQVQGRVFVSADKPWPGAKIVATNVETSVSTEATTDANGNYVLPALPAGQYMLVVTGPDGPEANDVIIVGTGQTIDYDIDVAVLAQGIETIEVRGTENKTSEVATNITREQLNSLPQNNRNFLNFALLAPATRASSDEFKKMISSGATDATQINVFVDGVSLKNNVLEGGVVGQDSSRGNPFPQLAVGGFRVLTQNFKAEYEQAGSAIISTVTKSGGNDPHVELFTSFQNKAMVAIDPFAEKLEQPKPDYSRYQAGGLVSGPIIENKLFALVTYEGNYQNRANQVQIGNRNEENLARFGRYEGSFTSPFREHLGFGKLTFVPTPEQTLDLSVSVRRETDVRNFGGTTSFENAENVRNKVYTAALRHQWRAPNDIVNEATAQVLWFGWNPGAENFDLIGQDFQGTIRVGGRDSNQDVRQRTITLRDDVSFPVVEAAGQHQFKVGAKVALQNYDETKDILGNPVFRYRIDPGMNLDYDIPFEAEFGEGKPDIVANNAQIGVYAQDDWRVNDHLTINAGVRWDVETNPLNNDFVTPADIRATLLDLGPRITAENGPGFFDVNNYVTDGNDRPIYFGAIQPRLGASYDIFGNQETVAFGGAGRYYDRPIYLIDEVYRAQYQILKVAFSRDGAMRDNRPTIVWDPAYMSIDALRQLAAEGAARPDVTVMANDIKPPYSDQYSFGVRQLVRDINLAATFSHIRGERGLGYYNANRVSSGDREFLTVVGNFNNVNAADDEIATRFTGVYFTADKPYTEDSKWGASLTYTLGWAKVRGDAFNGYDFNGAYPKIEDTPYVPTANDERHRVVASGIVGLPLDFKLATLIQLGSGLPYTIDDQSAGGALGERRWLRNGGRDDKFLEFSQIDLRVIKDFKFGGQRATLTAEVFNVLNAYNYGDYDGFKPAGDSPNPQFGQPRRIIGPTRSFQVGLAYAF